MLRPQHWLSDTTVAMQVSAIGWCYQGQHLTPVPIALRGRGVRQPSETLLEREFSGSRDGEGAQDLAQSRQSMGEHWCSGYTMICIDHH